MISTYMLSRVLPHVKRGRLDLDGDSIRIGRFEVFVVKGTRCVGCGLEAEFFKKESSNGAVILNLYGRQKVANGFRNILFTRDHIIPASRGGTRVLKNLQPMCEDCNGKKGDSVSFRDKVRQSVKLASDYFHGIHTRTKGLYKLIRAVWRPNFVENRWKV
jgi:HNH endonuclease